MPRPEQVIPRAAQGAPHGASAELQRLASATPMPGSPREAPTSPAAPPAPGAGAGPGTLGSELNDGFDPYLFASTSRPNEPITAGASFGAGPNYVPRRNESDRQFLLRVADDLERAPGAAREVRELVARIRRGE